MANNLQAESVVSAGSRFVTAEVTAYGDASSHLPGCFLAIVSGSEGSQTFAEVVGGAGAVSAGVQRMTLASDDPAVAVLGDAADAAATQGSTGSISAKLRTVTSQLNTIASTGIPITGTVTVGTHAVTQSGTWTVELGATDNAVLDAIAASLAGTLTVGTHAVTQSGTWTVDLGATDNAVLDAIAASLAGTLTVGTHAVTQSGTWTVTGTGGTFPVTDSGGTLTVDAPVGTPVFVRLSDGSSAISTLAVSLASVPSHAVTNIGTFAVQVDGSALTALQLIDDVVFVDDAAFTLGTSKGVMMMGFAGTQSVDANDAAALACTTAGALRVNVENASLTVASHAVTNAGVFAVQVDGSALTALQLIDDTVFTDDAAFTPGTSKVLGVGMQADESSTDSVDEGDIGCPRMTLDRKQIVTTQPHTAGGLSIFRSLDLDETEEDIKTSAGCIYGLWVTNTATSTRWVKFYNATAANVTVGSTTPVLTIGIPGNTSDDVAGLFASGHGIGFDTAISAACTTGVADADTGAPSANDLILNVFYK